MKYFNYKRFLAAIVLILMPLVFIVSLFNRGSSDEKAYSGISEETNVNLNNIGSYGSDEEYESYGDYGEEEKDITEEDLEVNHPQLKKGYKEVEPNAKPISLSKDGSIRIYKNKVIEPGKETKADVVIDFLFDPVCPASSAYNKMLHDELNKEIDEGKVEIRYKVVPYLNDKTIGDYSNRASSYVLATAEYSPDYAHLFIKKILSDDFQPSSPASKYTSDDSFKDVLIDIGVESKIISKIENNKDSFVASAIASSNNFENKNSKWLALSRWEDENGDPIAYTPFLIVNKKGSFGNKALKVHSVNPREELRLEVDNELK